MKTFISILILAIPLKLFGQTKTNILFFDACKNESVKLDFELWNPDTTINIEAGQSINLEPSYYQLSVTLTNNDLYSLFYFDLYITNCEQTHRFYLNKIRPHSKGALHSQKIEYYYCDELANGQITEYDQNNVIRTKGQFKQGIPITNIKYFNSQGNRIKTEVFRNGNYRTTKNKKK